MSRYPKPMQDIFDAYKGHITLERKTRHWVVRIGGQMVTAISPPGAKCKKQTVNNCVALLKRELKKRNLWDDKRRSDREAGQEPAEGHEPDGGEPRAQETDGQG